VPPPVAHGAPRTPRVDPAFDQRLPRLGLGLQPQEQPDEQRHGDERAVDEHHGAREALVRRRRHGEHVGCPDVDAVERRCGDPEEEVSEQRIDASHADDVAELRAGPDPLGRVQRRDHREPHGDSDREERHVLQRVHRLVTHLG